MTGYTVNTGSNEKFSTGWDRIFAAASAGAKKPPAAAPPSGKQPSRPKKPGGK